jgi:hypothetical protein
MKLADVGGAKGDRGGSATRARMVEGGSVVEGREVCYPRSEFLIR